MSWAGIILLLGIAADPVAADTVVVCPQEFLATMQPWIDHRVQQGHQIAVISSRLPARQIRDQIRQLASAGHLRSIVLVGDAPAAGADSAVREMSTPTHLADAKVNVKWGSEPQIATDNWYADLDDDLVPDVSIGRLTADSQPELALMIQKILSYEQQGSGAWCRRLSFVAGVGGFGPLTDSVLEMATKRFLTQGIPACYDTRMTYGSWRSPYCPDPRRFHETTLQRFNEGCLFWVYIGHGQRHYLDRVRVPGGTYHILDVRDAPKMKAMAGSPIAILLACYTGAFDDPRDCLGEEMLRSPQGPVAVLCGSRVTMPYAMAVMGNAMMSEYFEKQRETLGELMLQAKRRMMAGDTDDQNRQMLDALAAAISPTRDQLDDELREHLLLFNLLGDPLLRLPRPQRVELQSEYTVDAGQQVLIRGHSPIAGEMTIELTAPRDRLRYPAPTRTQYFRSEAELEDCQLVYQQAIDSRWHWTTLSVQQGEFQHQLPIPDDARGPCHVRALISNATTTALGSTEVFVRRPDPDQRGK